jgi:hypothetical protein
LESKVPVYFVGRLLLQHNAMKSGMKKLVKKFPEGAGLASCATSWRCAATADGRRNIPALYFPSRQPHWTFRGARRPIMSSAGFFLSFIMFYLSFNK